jgi:hypothetical protein
MAPTQYLIGHTIPIPPEGSRELVGRSLSEAPIRKAACSQAQLAPEAQSYPSAARL